MLEQSSLHGRIFCSMQSEKSVASKPVPLHSVAFGPVRPVRIYRISDADMWVENQNNGDFYHYKGAWGDISLKLEGQYKGPDIKISELTQGDGFPYYFGKALLKQQETEEHLYFVQNMPQVTYGGIPDVATMQMPLTMQALDYPQVFSYPDEIKALLGELPAAYADRCKRPVIKKRGRTYPVAMDAIHTTWRDLPETTYPVVLDFSKSLFAVADLEPEHTPEDKAQFDGFPGFYEEGTPRGGKHKLIRIKEDGFKFRYSKGLEIINRCQVTLYGLNARWLSENPEPVSMEGYREIGHQPREVHARLERPDVETEVAMLRKKAGENLSTATDTARRLYRADPDDSHGEFIALKTLYEQDIFPYARQFEKDLLPWVLESYARPVIMHREKHETVRHGLPYLVYLAAIIIERKKTPQLWNQES